MNGVDPEVQDFIRSSVDSVETLAILLLLRRSPDTFWSAAAIAEQLGMRAELVSQKLFVFHSRNVIRIAAGSGAYRFAPAEDRLAQCIDRLAAAFRDGRVTIENAIRSSRA